MKVWLNDRFKGAYPIGTSAIVVAATAEDAAQLLKADLKEQGLGDDVTPEQFELLKTNKPHVVVHSYGNY